ncbi:DUF6507 family protein [Streptomyces sparsus]
MSGWDLKPEGISGALEKTAEVARGLEKKVKSYSDNLESAATSAGTLAMGGERPEAGLVGAALAEFAQETQKDLQFIAARSGKSLEGAGSATKAYLAGDLAMAEEAQREALKAPELDLGKGGGGR